MPRRKESEFVEVGFISREAEQTGTTEIFKSRKIKGQMIQITDNGLVMSRYFAKKMKITSLESLYETKL